MKTWLLALMLAVPPLAYGQPPEKARPDDSIEGWEPAVPADPNEATVGWMDSSQSYATEKAQDQAERVDAYFGTPNYELEAPESQLRLDLTTDWDQQDGNNNNIRLRGKIQLPRVSKRLNVVFNEESGDELDPRTSGEPVRDDSFGLLYRVSEGENSRFDLTMGISWNHLRPGARYRYQGALGEANTYRFTQRLQYEDSEGAYATSQIELNRLLDQNTILRLNNRAVYGEETAGTEWISRLSLFQRTHTVNRNHVMGISYFGAVNGVTDPDYVKNYRLGVLLRRQVYRKYLFLELEPAYNYRKQDPEDKRQFAWSVALRLQIALERDLARKRDRKRRQQREVEELEAPPDRPLLAPEEMGSGPRPPPDSIPEGDDL